MQTKEKPKKKAPRTLRVRISDLLEKAIAGIEGRFAAKDFKPTMGDYFKLLQMEIELEQEETKEVKVTWVEPPVPSSSAK